MSPMRFWPICRGGAAADGRVSPGRPAAVGTRRSAAQGAPWTFDLNGFAVMLERLGGDDGRDVLVPVFDRDLRSAAPPRVRSRPRPG
ncbi:hypothetical protein FLP41_09910 [Paracoccus marcusii]|uniref:hypothetical protein n=1 Tax=Paracoccus marcusii TaxID=59779 RepID=UPI002ED592FB|nr:hypothetical protein FLP41_09910 [Paracoccus marcusii]